MSPRSGRGTTTPTSLAHAAGVKHMAAIRDTGCKTQPTPSGQTTVATRPQFDYDAAMQIRPALPLSVLLLVACGGEALPPQPPPQLAPAPSAVATPAIAAPLSVPAQVCSAQPARTMALTETKFGVPVSDPYRWMEGNDNAELTSWLHAQGECTQQFIGRIPGNFQREVQVGVLRIDNKWGAR